MLNLLQHPTGAQRNADVVKQPCVYIRANGYLGTIYIGVTSDLVARLHQHRTGAAEGFTRRYEVYRLVR